VVVAPLVSSAPGPKPIGRLEPVFKIQGVPCALYTAEMTAILSALPKDTHVADLSEFDYEIRGALDMVFQVSDHSE